MSDHPLVGIWKLVSMERIDLAGNVTEMEVLTGLLTYTAEGWMTEALEYRAPDSNGSATYMFYAGLYQIDGDTVIHQPRIHTNHELVWTEMPRQYEINGNRFTLTARNPNGAAYLVWEQIMT
jgi:hypothetical protein